MLAAELVTKSWVEVFFNRLVAVAERGPTVADVNVVAKLSVLMVTMLALVDEKIVVTAVETCGGKGMARLLTMPSMLVLAMFTSPMRNSTEQSAGPPLWVNWKAAPIKRLIFLGSSKRGG